MEVRGKDKIAAKPLSARCWNPKDCEILLALPNDYFLCRIFQDKNQNTRKANSNEIPYLGRDVIQIPVRNAEKTNRLAFHVPLRCQI